MAVPPLTRSAALQLDQRTDREITVMAVSGELDLSTAPALCRAIQPRRSIAGQRLVLDLRDVSFCDSTGLRALMGAVREIEAQAGGVAIVVAPGSSVDRTLTLSGAREFLDVTHGLEDARRRLGAA